jgi:hypothetical protein
MKDPEAFIQRNVIVDIFFGCFVGFLDYALSPLSIARLGLADIGHFHVRSHIHVAFHGIHGVGTSRIISVICVFIPGHRHVFHIGHVRHVVPRHTGHGLLPISGRRILRLSPRDAAE